MIVQTNCDDLPAFVHIRTGSRTDANFYPTRPMAICPAELSLLDSSHLIHRHVNIPA